MYPVIIQTETCSLVPRPDFFYTSFFLSKKGGGAYDTECACSVLDLIFMYLVLHVKDMSFDKQDASYVTDQQHKTRHRFTTTSIRHQATMAAHVNML